MQCALLTSRCIQLSRTVTMLKMKPDRLLIPPLFHKKQNLHRRFLWAVSHVSVWSPPQQKIISQNIFLFTRWKKLKETPKKSLSGLFKFETQSLVVEKSTRIPHFLLRAGYSFTLVPHIDMTMSNMMEKLIPDSTEDQLCASLPTPNAALLRATLRLSGTACHSDHSFFFLVCNHLCGWQKSFPKTKIGLFSLSSSSSGWYDCVVWWLK